MANAANGTMEIEFYKTPCTPANGGIVLKLLIKLNCGFMFYREQRTRATVQLETLYFAFTSSQFILMLFTFGCVAMGN